MEKVDESAAETTDTTGGAAIKSEENEDEKGISGLSADAPFKNSGVEAEGDLLRHRPASPSGNAANMLKREPIEHKEDVSATNVLTDSEVMVETLADVAIQTIDEGDLTSLSPFQLETIQSIAEESVKPPTPPPEPSPEAPPPSADPSGIASTTTAPIPTAPDTTDPAATDNTPEALAPASHIDDGPSASTLGPSGPTQTVPIPIAPAPSTASTTSKTANKVGDTVSASVSEKKTKKPGTSRRRKHNPYIKVAQRVMRDKVDLAVCLSTEDSDFLARNFWVFTVDQLAYLVGESDSENAEKMTDLSSCPLSTRHSFLTNVAMLMQPDGQPINKKVKLDHSLSKEETKPVECVTASMEENQVGDGAVASSSNARLNSVGGIVVKTDQQTSAPLASEESTAMVIDSPGVGSNKTEETSISSGVVRKATVTDDTMKKASDRIIGWKSAISEVNLGGKKTMKKQFRVEGAIRVLFPSATRNFLKSIGIETLWDFLSLRKQENAPICNSMNTWRMSCGIMTPATSFTLSKHLCGVATRVETAISSIPPVTEELRLWMKGPINCLSGAARDFVVIDQGITTVEQFLSMRTKDLSIKLEAWRKAKGMEPLKGSGKVAMISAWKTFSRDLLEIEQQPGKVVDMSAVVQHDIIEGKEESNKTKSRTKKRAHSENDIDPSSPLLSSEFLVTVLGTNIADALASAGVRHGKHLFETDCKVGSPFYKSLVDFGVVDSAASFVEDIQKWKSSVFQASQKHLEAELKRSQAKITQAEPLAESRKHETAPTKRKSGKGKAWSEPEQSNDPFEALSATSKEFLGSIGISTAEDFLSARSTDVSLEFIKWRIATGKPALKGCGAVASVSGWKAIVRKRAQETGLDDISELEPTENTAAGRCRRMPVRAHSSPRPNAPSVDKGFFANNLGPALKTIVKKDFAVDGCTAFAVESRGKSGFSKSPQTHLTIMLLGSQGRFFFELSRRDNSEGKTKTFVTYRGFEKGTPTNGNTVIVDVDSGKCVSRLRILRKSTSPVSEGKIKTASRPFCAVHSSGGLVDLSAFDVAPDADEDLNDMKLIVSRFVGNAPCKPGESNETDTDKRGFNVWAMKSSVDTFQQLLFLRKPVEKGQCVELTHGSILSSFLNKGDYNHIMVETAIALLSTGNCATLLTWLQEESKKLCDTGSIATTWITSRRLRWIATRVTRMRRSNIAGEPLAAIAKACNELHVPPEHLPSFIDTTSKEIEREFLAFLDLDTRIGSLARQRWFPLAQDFFGEIVSIMSQSAFVPAADNLRKYLDSKLQEENLSSFESLSFSCSRTTTEFTENCSLELFETNNGNDIIGCVMSPDNGETFDFLGIAEYQDEKHRIAAQWYRSFLLNLFGEMISAYGLYLTHNSEKEVDLVPVLSEMKLKWDTSGIARPFQPRFRPSIVFSHASPPCVPNSLPYFLDIVWPVMQDRGWAMVVGDEPSEIVFSPKQKKLESLGHVKQQRDEQIEGSKRSLVGMGFGIARKATKRLLIQASELEESEPISDSTSASVLSVKAVLEKFSEHLSENDYSTAQQERVRQVIGQVERIFDSFAGRMGIAAVSKGTKPCSSCSGHNLLTFLPLLPDIIRQVDRPRKEFSDALAVVHDLLAFVVSQHETLFPESVHLSPEDYDDEQEQLSSPHFNPMITRQAIAVGEESEDSTAEFGPTLSSQDNERLSDFMVCLLSNAVPFHANRDDVEKKKFRISVGTPGLVCKHCMGVNYEGRYFFSSVESLTASYTCLEKHYLKCSKTPDDVKKTVVKTRSTHASQRKVLKMGSQQAYFNDLWNRYKTKKVTAQIDSSYAFSGVVSSPIRMQPSHEMDEREKAPVKEFSNHVRLIASLGKGEPDEDLEEALDRYYACLDYGGRVNMTKEMPKHYSAAWLVAKIVPKEYLQPEFDE